MIVIRKGQSNTVTVTLKEKTTLANPYYLFQFESKVTKQKVYAVPTDLSQYPNRYNQFQITESNTPTGLSQVTLLPEGEWVYTVYEQTSSTNTNPANATGVVETGLCKVIGTTQSNTVYNTATTRTVYNG